MYKQMKQLIREAAWLDLADSIQKLGNNEGDAEKLIGYSKETNHPMVRHMVALNPHTPTAALDHIFDTTSMPMTREAIGLNPNASPASFVKAVTANPEIALQNPSLPLYELENPSWFHNLKNPGKYTIDSNPSFWAPRLATHPSSFTRTAVAMHPHTDPEILHRLSDDPDEGVKIALATNHKISDQTLHKLTQDPSPSVRQQALQHPKITEKPKMKSV